MSRGVSNPVASEPPSPWTVRLDGSGTPSGSGGVVARRVASADSFWARFMGLMGRTSLPADEGLYLAGNSIHMFFMRFPIDAVFVGKPDASGARSVVACKPDLRPWTSLVMPVRGAAGVIELPAGSIARAGVQAGAIVRFEAP